jgi:hypothetical protein
MRKKKAAEPIILTYTPETLRGNSTRILKVWVKRFVENGDKVVINLDQSTDTITFECPDAITELHVSMLCDIIKHRGFATDIFRCDY